MRRLSASPWLLPLIGTVVIDGVDGKLVDLLGYDAAAASVILVGALIGGGWYLAAPRPLADRLFPFCVLGMLVVALTLLPGDGTTTVDMPGALSLVGIVGGLAIAERFHTPESE